MPVFNEDGAIERVVREWLPALRSLGTPFVLGVIDDGSTDATPSLLKRLAASTPELRIVERPHAGHGAACVHGYRLALESGAAWILQLDSDGQCDPAFLESFWASRGLHPVTYGYRAVRDDGRLRWTISRVVSLVVMAATGEWVRDPNVPYRLMRADAFAGLIGRLRPDTVLPNVVLAALQKRRFGIRWIDIRFRRRFAGSSKARLAAYAGIGARLFCQLRTAVR